VGKIEMPSCKTGLEREAENIPEIEEKKALSPTKWAKY
jgi:hypothetical protein